MWPGRQTDNELLDASILEAQAARLAVLDAEQPHAADVAEDEEEGGAVQRPQAPPSPQASAEEAYAQGTSPPSLSEGALRRIAQTPDSYTLVEKPQAALAANEAELVAMSQGVTTAEPEDRWHQEKGVAAAPPDKSLDVSDTG